MCQQYHNIYYPSNQELLELDTIFMFSQFAHKVVVCSIGLLIAIHSSSKVEDLPVDCQMLVLVSIQYFSISCYRFLLLYLETFKYVNLAWLDQHGCFDFYPRYSLPWLVFCIQLKVLFSLHNLSKMLKKLTISICLKWFWSLFRLSLSCVLILIHGSTKLFKICSLYLVTR